jgi:hypothetical protein
MPKEASAKKPLTKTILDIDYMKDFGNVWDLEDF